MTHPNETPEPLAQGQAGEMPEPVGFRSRYRSEPEMIGHYPWTYADSERRRRKYDRPECDYEDLYTAEQMREYATAALQAKDAEVARLKADAGTVAAILAVDVGGRPGVHGQTMGADGAGQFAYIIRGTQEQADNWACEHIRQREKSGQQFFSCVLVFNEKGYGGPMLTEIDAAIRAQTGGEG